MLIKRLKKFLLQTKEQSVDLLFRRDLIAQWIVEAAKSTDRQQDTTFRILDFGCGRGDDLQMVSQQLKENQIFNVELFGIECYTPSIHIAEEKGIRISSANIETDRFPFADRFFDVVISNQTIEHTKEIFWIFGEASRVLKPGGLMVTGVPNLASFHNRMMLLFGEQPTNIELLGPHVRGITAKSFRRFIEAENFFQVTDIQGGHFYPFPRWLAVPLSRIFPEASASIFIKAMRTPQPGEFHQVLEKRFFETPYYRGPQQITEKNLQ